MFIFGYIFDNCSCSLKIKCHNMHIYNIMSMFEEKFANIFEEMVLLKGNLPIFWFIKFAYKAIYICLKTWLSNEYSYFIKVFFYILINYLGPSNKKEL